MTDVDFIVLGRLARPHSIRGEIRLEYFADSLELLDKPLWLRAGGGQPSPVRIVSYRVWRDQVVVLLEGVSDRTAAEMLRGQELLLAEADLPETEDDEPYLRDLVGLPVVLASTGELVGYFEEALFLAGQEVWSLRAAGNPENPAPNPDGKAVENAGGHEILFPAVPEFVDDIDLEAGVIRISPPPGLLDIYREAADNYSAPKAKRQPKRRPKPRKPAVSPDPSVSR